MRFVCVLAVVAFASLHTADIDAQVAPTLLAFRFDSQRIIATLKSEINVSLPQLARGVPRPGAKFGYPIFDLPAELQPRVPQSIRPGDRRSVHTAAGQVFHATVERIVLGEAQCSRMLAAVLKIDDSQAWAFAGVRSKYYVVEPDLAPPTAEPSPLGDLAPTAIAPEIRRSIERTLAGLHAGAGRSYDAQPYRLTPDGAPFVFVRATWHTEGRPTFVASLWVRGDTGEVAWREVLPAERLRIFERGMPPELPGLVLNVVDRDRDGWAEIVFVQVGYEGVEVSLREARARFQPSGISYHYGC